MKSNVTEYLQDFLETDTSISKYAHSPDTPTINITNVTISSDQDFFLSFYGLNVQIIHCRLDSLQLMLAQYDEELENAAQNPRMTVHNSSFKSLDVQAEMKLEITDCHIDAKSIPRPTLLISSNSQIVIRNSKFHRFVNRNGPTILNSESNSHVNIDESVFSDHLSRVGVLFLHNNSNMNIQNTTFNGNTALYDGGTIHVKNQVELNITDCIFEENSARNGGAIFGGNNDCFIIHNTTFKNNDASGKGGAISMQYEGQLIMKSSTLEENSARREGGAIEASFNTSIEVYLTYFANNFARLEGGALNIVLRSYLLVTSCTFQENFSVRGGAIQSWRNTPTEIYYSNFTKNKASVGGSIHISEVYSGKVQLLVNNCNFEENFANDFAGAINVIYSLVVQIDMCTFINNVNRKVGGAISAFLTDTMSIEKCIFTNNTAGQAGAIFLEEVKMFSLRNTDFFQNKAFLTNAGALLFSRTQISIEKCVFSESTAVGYGGAISGGESGIVYICTSHFMHNEAGEGGAIFLRNIGSSQINETVFSYNNAILKAGAVALNLNVSSNIYQCEFKANTAGNGGAITFDNFIKANVDSVIFFQNRARGFAGAISIELGQEVFVNMKNTSCVGNIASAPGGCIGSRNGANIKIIDGAFSKNRGALYGDAYAGTDANLQVGLVLNLSHHYS